MWNRRRGGTRRFSARLVWGAITALLIPGILALGPAVCSAKGIECPDGFSAYTVHGATLLLKTETACDKGSVFAVMLAGTGDQAPGETHCAHVAEHTVFRNPVKGGPRSLAEFVSGWGGIYNGWTGPDHTHFELSVPHENVPEILALLVRALFPAEIAELEFRQELDGRLKQELEYMTTNELSAPWNALRLQLFAGTAYDEQLFATPVVDVPSERVLGYMQREYSPQRLLLVVVADVDPSAVVEAADKELRPVPEGEAPEQRLTELSPRPALELPLPKVEKPLVLVGMGIGGVPEEQLPYLTLAHFLLMDLLSKEIPAGLDLDPQACGHLPVQGAACWMQGYRVKPGAGTDVSELASAAVQHVRGALALLESGVTEQQVAGLLEALLRAARAESPELPAHIPASLYEAYTVGIAAVPGTAFGLGDFFSGASAPDVKLKIDGALAQYAGQAKLTVVFTRRTQGPLGAWVWLLLAVLAAAGVLIWAGRRRRSRTAAGIR